MNHRLSHLQFNFIFLQHSIYFLTSWLQQSAAFSAYNIWWKVGNPLHSKAFTKGGHKSHHESNLLLSLQPRQKVNMQLTTRKLQTPISHSTMKIKGSNLCNNWRINFEFYELLFHNNVTLTAQKTLPLNFPKKLNTKVFEDTTQTYKSMGQTYEV